MKRILASVGLVAIGAAAIQTSNAQDPSKNWTISAALRGFYDDNVGTTSVNEVDTFGFEIAPSIGFTLPLEQTSLSLVYTYAFKYYDKRPEPGADHDDQTHTVTARLLHQFSERTSVRVRNSFVVGQEPDIDSSFASFQRISGNNFRNYGSVAVNHQITPLIGVEVGYANSLFDYENDHGDFTTAPVITGIGGVPLGVYPVGVVPSRSGLLDRIEHRIHVNGRWTLANNSILLLGYDFGMGCYTGDEPIGVRTPDANIANNTIVTSGMRDYYSHYGYVGLEHTFRPDLTGSIRGGVRFTDYYQSPNEETSVSPYAEATLRYLYARDSHIEVGVKHDQTASDAFSIMGNSITTDVDATSVYGAITHAITPDLSGTLMGRFQNNTYNGGSLDGDNEQYYAVSLSLAYQINRHLAATASYHFDHVESDRGNNFSYDRNRVFLGAVFTY